MAKIKSSLARLRDTDGAEILEAAIVLPLLFLFLLGIVEFGRVFNINSTIQQAAQQGAIAAARNSCATCGNSVTAAAVNTAINTVLQGSNLNPSQIQLPPSGPDCSVGQSCNSKQCPSPPWPPASCSTSSQVRICQNVQLNPTFGGAEPVQCGAVVSFQYPFTFNLPFTSINLQQIILSAQAQTRMEN